MAQHHAAADPYHLNLRMLCRSLATSGVSSHVYSRRIAQHPLGRQCRSTNRNGDGITSAADLTALLRLYAPAAPAEAGG